MYFLGKSSPTTPTSLTGLKKLAATAAWLAEPPSRRGFSALGVLIESSAVEPTIKTLIGNSSSLSIEPREARKGATGSQWQKRHPLINARSAGVGTAPFRRQR